MNNSIKQYSAFLENIGHKTVVLDDVLWFDTQPRVFSSLPIDSATELSESSKKRLFDLGALVIRHTCPPSEGVPSYAIQIKDSDYDLTSLTSKSRNQTRRGLENCDVTRFDISQYHSEAIRLNRETLERQGRKISTNHDAYWKNYFQSVSNCDVMEAWSARVNGELAAYLIAAHLEGTMHIMIVRSAKSYLSSYPNNALIFSFAKAFFDDKKGDTISIGLESLQQGMQTLDHFKTGLGFIKVDIHQRVELAPWLDKFCKPMVLAPMEMATSKLSAKNEKIAKLSGLIKLYKTQFRTANSKL